MLLAIGLAAVSSPAMAQTAIETDSSNNTGYTVPSTAQNLLSAASVTLSANPSVPSNFNGENTNNTNYAPLTDGSFGTVGSLDPTTTSISNGNTLTYTLGGSPGGYTISEIDTYTGWQDSGRIDPNFQIFYTTATNNTLQALSGANVNFTNTAGTDNSTFVQLAVSGLTNVTSIEFAFGTQQAGYVGYKELAVQGAQSVPTDTWTGTAGTGTYSGFPVGTNGIWDSTSGSPPAPTANWSPNSTYTDGDIAVFDNTGINTNIAIQPGGVAPYNVTFNNSTNPYSFTNSTGDVNGIKGSATVTLSASAGAVTYNSPNTYSGGTTINGGSLRINDPNSLQNSTATVNVNGGLLFGPGHATYNLGGLAGSGSIALQDTNSGGINLSVGSNNANTVYSGSFSGSGSLTKVGTGVLNLTGSGSYAGTTRITAGTLRVTAVNPTPGLFEGLVSNGGGGQVYTAIPHTNGPFLDPRMAYAGFTTGQKVYPAGIPDNSVVGYDGYINNFTANPVTYTFAENFDDNVFLKIDGNTVLNDTNWNVPTEANYTLTPGSHTFQLYLGQGGGGVGFSNQSWFNNNLGFGIDFQGRDAQVASDFVEALDPGNGSLFSTIPGPGGQPISNTNAVIMSSNTTFDINSTLITIGSVSDTGAVGTQILLGTGVLTTGNDNTNTTFSGVISGAGGLTKIGTGTFILANANTFSGSASINAGVLQLNNANALQNATATINTNSNSTTPAGLVFNSGITNFNLGGLAGSANLAMTDTASQPVNLAVGNSLGNNPNYSGVLTGGGTFTKVGSNTQTLSGINAYAGNTFITGGTLRLGTSAANNAIGVHFGVDQQGGADTLAPTTSAGVSPASVAGVNFAMTHWNNASGATGNASNITNSAGVGSGASVSWSSAGTQSAGGTFTGDNQLMATFLNSNGTSTVTFTNIPYATYEVVSYVGAEGQNGRTASVSAFGSTDPNPPVTYYFQTSNNTGAVPYQYAQITNTTAGTFPAGNYAVSSGLSGSTLTVNESNFSSFSGIMGVEIINTSVLPTTTALSIATGSSLDLGGTYQQVASLNDFTPGTSFGTVTNSGPFLGTLGVAPSGTSTFTGVIQDGAAKTAFVMSGAGTQVLAGVNTYTGGTTVNNGTLIASPTGTLGTGTLRVSPPGAVTLQNATQNVSGLTGTGTVNMNGGTASNLTVTGGPSTFNGLLQGTAGSGLTVSSTGNFTLASTANTYSGGTTVNGTLNIPNPGSTGTIAPLGPGAVTVGSTGNLNIAGLPQGLVGSYYNGFSATGNFATLSALNAYFNTQTPNLVQNTISAGANLDFGTGGGNFPAPYNANNPTFQAVYRGYINIPTTGIYSFGTASDDGSMIFLDGQDAALFNNNFGQGVTERSNGTTGINLTAGAHSIVIAYYNSGGGYGFQTFFQAGTTTSNGPSGVPDATQPSTLLSNSILLSGSSFTTLISGLNGSAGGSVNLAPFANLQIGSNNLSSNYGGSFTGTSTESIRITTGSGVFTISGNSQPTFTAPITISSGTLRLANTSGSATGKAPISVGDGTGANPTFLGGTGSTTSPVTVNGAGPGTFPGTILGVGASQPGGGTLSLAGGLTFQDGSFANFNLGTPNGTANPALALIATSGPTNSLMANGTDTISFSNPSVGTYDLISYTGSTASSNFVLDSNSIANYAGLTFQLLNGSGQIDLLVSTPPIIWSGVNGDGNGNAAWDYNTANWVTANGTATKYVDPNGVVTFGDFYPNGNSVVNSSVVIQPGGVQPLVVTLNGSGLGSGGVDYTFSDADGVNGIGGAASIILNAGPTGNETVTFLSPNSFTGAVSVNAGYLNIENSGALGASSGVAVANGAVLQLQSPDGTTPVVAGTGVPLAISGTGDGSGALQNVLGNNTYAGLITGSGTIASNDASGSLTLSGGLNPQGNTLSITGPGPVNITTGVSGTAGTIEYGDSLGLGTNTLTLSGANTFTGLTQIDAGTFIVTNTGALNGNLTYNSSSTSTINGTLGGAPAVLHVTNGTLILNGANTYGGGTTLTSGTIRIGASASLSGQTLVSNALGSGTATLNGGTLQDNGSPQTLANSFSLNGNVTFSSSGSGSLTLDGTGLSTPSTFNVAGNSSLTVTNTTTITDVITGSSNLSLGGTGLLILNNANAFTGGTTVAPSGSGTVRISNTNALQNSVVTLNTPGGLTFNSGIGSVALGGLSGSTNLTMSDLSLPASPNVALTLGNSNSVGSSAGSYGGKLTASSLTKVGSSTQTLTGDNTYTGTVSVNQGLLRIGPAAPGDKPLGTAPITLNGGTLRLLGVGGNTTLSGFGGTSTSVTGTGTGWTVNNAGIASNPINSNVLTLTDGATGEARSAFYSTPVSYLSGFTASFNYTATPGTANPPADGIAFVLQNSSVNALGGGGGSIGYQGITPSAALEFEIYNGAAGYFGRTGFDTNGNIGENNNLAMVNLNSGNPINVTLTYNSGGTISETLLDTVTHATESFSYTQDLGSVLGNGGNALIGFTGATGGASSNETISNFSITYAGVNSVADYSANNVTLTGGDTATIDVAIAANLPTASMGTLTVGNGSNTTLNITASGAPATQPYGLTLGSVSLQGNVNINVANNTNGGGNALGTLTLGSLNDNGSLRTITLGGAGAVTLNNDATSLGVGTVINLNNGTLNSNSGMAIGNGATLNLGSPASKFSAGATQTISALNGLSGQVVIGSSATLTVGSSDNLSSAFAGIISGSGGLVKDGSGTLTLTGANTFGGGLIGTKVNNGTLAVGPTPLTNATTPLSTGLVTLSGGTLALQGQLATNFVPGLVGQFYNGAANVNNSNPNFNTLSILQAHLASETPLVTALTTTAGYPNLNFSNNNYSGQNSTMFGATSPGNPSLGQAPFGFTQQTNLEAYFTGYIQITTGGSYTFNTTSDDGSMLFLGATPLAAPPDAALVSNNSYQGQTTKSGTLSLTPGLYPIDIGYYQGGGGEGLNISYSGPDTSGNTVSIPNTVLFNGTFVLNASQTYSNSVSVTNDSTINVTASLTASMGPLSIGSNTLNVNSSDTSGSMYTLTMGATTLTGNPTFNVTNSSGNGQGVLVLGALGDGGMARTIAVNGSGAVALTAPASSLGVGTVVNVTGNLFLGAPGALGTTATVNVNGGGTLALGANQTLSALNSTLGGGTVLLNYLSASPNTLTVGSTDGLASSFGGTIADGTLAGGNLTVASGSLILTGSSTLSYTGATTVNGGTLLVNSSLSTTSSVTVGGASATGSPTIGGSGPISPTGGPVVVNAAGGGAAGHIAPSGFGLTTPTTTIFANGLTLASGLAQATDGPQLDMQLSTSFGSDLINVTGGTLSVGNNVIVNIDAFGGSLAAATDYPLIDFVAGTTVGNISTWTVGTHTGDSGHTYSFVELGGNQIDLVVVSGGNTGSGEWVSSSGQLWSGGANWDSGNSHPDGAGQFATFGTGTQTQVQIDGNYTVGLLNFTAGSAYTLASITSAANGLTLNNGGPSVDAQVNVAGSNAADVLNTKLTLASTSGNTTFTIQPTSSLKVGSSGTSSGISGSNQGITLAGGGRLELAAKSTYNGPTTVNSGTLQIDAGASIASTTITVGVGSSLQLAGTTNALPAAANIATKGGGPGADGAVSLSGTATESIGTVTGDSGVNGDGAQVYTGSMTVGDGINVASLTATQILQNTLTINANSTVTIAPSAGAGGGVVAAASTASASPSTASAGTSGDPFTAIQDAIAAGSITSVRGQQLENRIAAIERLATTDPGLDVSLLESRVLAALPSSSLSSTDASPLADSGSGLIAADTSAFDTGSSGSGSSGTFAAPASFSGSPAAVPEPSTLLLAAFGGLGLAFAARRRRAASKAR